MQKAEPNTSAQAIRSLDYHDQTGHMNRHQLNPQFQFQKTNRQNQLVELGESQLTICHDPIDGAIIRKIENHGTVDDNPIPIAEMDHR